MYKHFPHTVDGDQICVCFDYEEELNAFKRAEHLLKYCLGAMKKHDLKEERGFVFETTLQAKVAKEKCDVLCKILGIKVLNVFSKDYVVIVRSY